MTDDIFDAALNLEDTSYSEGYDLGHSDGSRAGLLEGRAFGLEKGFEKFLEMGRFHGRACVWGARMPVVPTSGLDNQSSANVNGARETKQVPALGVNARLERHVRTLFALTEASQVTTVNEEDAVSEVDDRIKRAASKAKVIERMAGEQPVQTLGADGRGSAGTGVRLANPPPGEINIEDFGVGVPKRTS